MGKVVRCRNALHHIYWHDIPFFKRKHCSTIEFVWSRKYPTGTGAIYICCHWAQTFCTWPANVRCLVEQRGVGNRRACVREVGAALHAVSPGAVASSPCRILFVGVAARVVWWSCSCHSHLPFLDSHRACKQVRWPISDAGGGRADPTDLLTKSRPKDSARRMVGMAGCIASRLHNSLGHLIASTRTCQGVKSCSWWHM